MADSAQEHELHAYLDGELEAADRQRIEAYLAANPAERSRVESYRRQKALLKAALQHDDHASVSSPRFSMLEQRATNRLPRHPRKSVWRQAAAAALLLSLGAAGPILFQAYMEWRVPPMVEAATRAHEIFGNDTQRPVELPASAAAHMQSWFGEHLGAEVIIPNLNSVGMRLMGGRLLTGPDGPMAQLLYQDRAGSRLTVYLSGATTGGDEDIQVVKVSNYSAGYWREGEFKYAIVGEMGADDLREIAFGMTGANAPSRF